MFDIYIYSMPEGDYNLIIEDQSNEILVNEIFDTYDKAFRHASNYISERTIQEKLKWEEFLITAPEYIGEKPTGDKYKYRWTISKTSDSGNTFVIGWIWFNEKESGWEFESCGDRFLHNYKVGLIEWIRDTVMPTIYDYTFRREIGNDD